MKALHAGSIETAGRSAFKVASSTALAADVLRKIAAATVYRAGKKPRHTHASMTAGLNKMGQRRLQLQPVKARIVFGHDRPLGDRPKSHHDKPRPAELDSGGSGRLRDPRLA